MRIEGCAFSGCSGLTSITIPDRVTIGQCAFDGADRLAVIEFLGAPPKTEVGYACGSAYAAFRGVPETVVAYYLPEYEQEWKELIDDDGMWGEYDVMDGGWYALRMIMKGSVPTAELMYCIVDLSAGADATSYPVTYMSEPPSGGFNTDEYKTTKLVLRRIEPGTFIMRGQYPVTLTKTFYCGIFEVTQKQYALVTGNNPSSYKGNMRPVERVTWNTIRGDSSIYDWPTSANVDPTSFMGRLRVRAGLTFDLPTEAQWEYACRAGTTSAYNNGGDTEADLKLLGRYCGNTSDGKGGCSEHTIVGSYMPNAWGLYDMHGNVWEWCLDWWGTLAYGTDPKGGSSSGSDRVLRGGGWSNGADSCSSSNRNHYTPSYGANGYGFRLVRTLSE
jgi:hypothetical protein